jgi:hypothetical protein
MSSDELSRPLSRQDALRAEKNQSSEILYTALDLAADGISSHIHTLDENVTFMLDNQQEVVLRVREIDVAHQNGRALYMRVIARTDFQNVLILAKKINMKMGPFSSHFSVILSASPEFLENRNKEIIGLERLSDFFETLDEIKRPIFLNLNHYVISRISD